MESIEMRDGKEVKVYVKEVLKHTAACEICRVRKRKCDGKAPCTYCSEKGLVCQFVQQRKRGPKKAKILSEVIMASSNSNSLSTASLDCQLIDQLEANKYATGWHMAYVNLSSPVDLTVCLMAPSTPSLKIQAYTALAMSSRLCGDIAKSRVYLSTARQLAGVVFDTADANTVAAMMMLAQYWYLVLDIPLYRYYTNMAYNLYKMSRTPITGRLAAKCELSNLMNFPISHDQKVILLRQIIKNIKIVDKSDELWTQLVQACTSLIPLLGFCLTQPTEEEVEHMFYLIDHVSISEADRVNVLQAIDCIDSVLSIPTPGLISDDTNALRFTFSNLIHKPAYTAVVEWKSGHITEAMNSALVCIGGLLRMKNANVFGVISKYINLARLAFIAKFLYEEKQYFLALQMCGFIKESCEIVKPDFDFLIKQTDEFITTRLETINPNNLSPDPSVGSPPSPTLPYVEVSQLDAPLDLPNFDEAVLSDYFARQPPSPFDILSADLTYLI